MIRWLLPNTIRPSFIKLDELYRKHPQETYIWRVIDGYVNLETSTDGTVVYRDFAYDNANKHNGHKVKLSMYCNTDGKAVNYSFECFDCNEVIYSADKPVSQNIDSEVEFEIEDINITKKFDPKLAANNCYRFAVIMR